MNELIKYHNDLNRVPFSGFTHKDYNILFSIISRMRDQGTNSITFTYKYLMKISGLHYGHRLSQFEDDLDSVYHKMLTLGGSYSMPGHRGGFNLFQDFDIDTNNHQVTIDVTPKFAYILNKLTKNFTRLSLLNFRMIRSPKSQTLYRLTQQYRTVGRLYLKMDKFKLLLDVPKSYNADLIRRKVLRTAILELTPIIRGFHIIPKKRGRGGKVVGYYFYFSAQARREDYFSKGRIGDLRQMIKYVKFNSFMPKNLKKIDLERLSGRHITHKKEKEPMSIFNHFLKTASLDDLKQVNELRKHHSPAVHLSEYQARKLRRTIKRKEPKSKTSTEELLKKTFGVPTSKSEKHEKMKSKGKYKKYQNTNDKKYVMKTNNKNKD